MMEITPFHPSRVLILTLASICWSLISVESYTFSSQTPRFPMKTTLGMAEEAPTIAEFAKFVERKSRPEHVGIPRKRMELTFSVQLMRASYAVVDDLDFVPMDEFQKDFFLYRQDEWEDYRGYHPTVMQGDLADPLYFDFISFAQYVVIGDKMRKGQEEFVERNGAEGNASVIRRDPMYLDNKLLPEAHSTILGNRILDFIYEKYPASLVPSLSKAKIVDAAGKEALIRDLQMLLDIFTINSYCLSAEISEIVQKNPKTQPSIFPITAKFVIRAPSNLWSDQALRKRKENPINDFEIKTIKALARKWGLVVESVSTNVLNKIDVVHVITINEM